jgi:hypothetical protein
MDKMNNYLRLLEEYRNKLMIQLGRSWLTQSEDMQAAELAKAENLRQYFILHPDKIKNKGDNKNV